MAMAPTSPRLPSPPPPVENQIGPKSPSGGAAADIHTTPMEQSLLDANSKRRIHPGTKAADMAAGPPLIPLNEVCRYLLAMESCTSDSNLAGLGLSTTRTPRSLALPPYRQRLKAPEPRYSPLTRPTSHRHRSNPLAL